MDEFWESLFKKEGNSWGFEPSDSAILISNIFQERGYSKILIPGVGYGRNVKPFTEKKMEVTGIEISKTAIDLLNESADCVNVHHGSVLDMPFDNEIYDGIFSYALLHLFGLKDRKRIISQCFKQLKSNGMMVFGVVSPESEIAKTGKRIGKNRFRMPNGLKVFFYDDAAIEKEFVNFGLIEYKEIDEPIKFRINEPAMKFKLIICIKK